MKSNEYKCVFCGEITKAPCDIPESQKDGVLMCDSCDGRPDWDNDDKC